MGGSNQLFWIIDWRGPKKEQDVYDAVHKLHEILEEQNLIFYE
jgi:hypothetical protein